MWKYFSLLLISSICWGDSFISSPARIPPQFGNSGKFLTTNGSLLSWGTAGSGNAITALTSDVTASGPGSVAATVASVGGSTAANIHLAELLANAATSSNTASRIVKRDGSGGFSMGILDPTAITSSSDPFVISAAGQSIGLYGGATPGLYLSDIRSNADNFLSLSPDSRTLKDVNSLSTVDWNARTLIATSGSNVSLDWLNAALINGSGQTTLAWNSGLLLNPSTSNISVDWFNRTLTDTSNVITVEWDSERLTNGAGVHSVDWGNYQLTAGGSILSADWSSRILYDSSGNASVDWFDRVLIDSANNPALVWENGTHDMTLAPTGILTFAPTSGHVNVVPLTASRVVVTDASNYLASSSVTPTQLGLVVTGQGSTTFNMSTGAISGITANEIVGGGKTGQAMTIRSATIAAAGFTCTGNPTFKLLDCGTSAGACTAGTTTLATVTLTAANTLTAATINSASIASGHFWAWEITAGTCAALNATGSAEAGSVLQ